MNNSLAEIDIDHILNILSDQEQFIWVQNADGIKIHFGTDVVLKLTLDDDKLIDLHLNYPYDHFNSCLKTQIQSFEQLLYVCMNIEYVTAQECIICNSLFQSGCGSIHQNKYIQLDNIDQNMLQVIHEQGLMKYKINKQLVQLQYTHQEIQPFMRIKQYPSTYGQIIDNIFVNDTGSINYNLCDSFIITSDEQILPYHSECMKLVSL